MDRVIGQTMGKLINKIVVTYQKTAVKVMSCRR
jgi:hypothetical protein